MASTNNVTNGAAPYHARSEKKIMNSYTKNRLFGIGEKVFSKIETGVCIADLEDREKDALGFYFMTLGIDSELRTPPVLRGVESAGHAYVSMNIPIGSRTPIHPVLAVRALLSREPYDYVLGCIRLFSNPSKYIPFIINRDMASNGWVEEWYDTEFSEDVFTIHMFFWNDQKRMGTYIHYIFDYEDCDGVWPKDLPELSNSLKGQPEWLELIKPMSEDEKRNIALNAMFEPY